MAVRPGDTVGREADPRAAALAAGSAPRPYHVVPPAAGRPAGRRLLLVSEHFPPSHSVGALRWQMLARYAAERGWGLDVVTLDPASHAEGVDAARLAQLPPDVRIYVLPRATPRLARFVSSAWRLVARRLLRRGVAGGAFATATTAAAAPVPPAAVGQGSHRRAEILDRRLEPRDLIRAYLVWLEYAQGWRWAKDAAALARRIVQPGVHRAVVTSGPPHTVHEAGRLVSRRHALPFVMDLRDPWSLAQRLPEATASRLWYRLAASGERVAVAQAALVVANTEASSRALRALYPAAATRVITVMNGADDEPMPIPSSADGGPFVVAYAGTIYLDRDPRPLFHAAARVIRELGLTPAQIVLRFLGDTEGFDLHGAARAEGIAEFVTLAPPRPRAEALRFLADAALLVSLPQDSTMAVPAKVFEYVQFDAWLLAFAERDSATELVLRDSGADVVAPGDVDASADVLRRRYAEFVRGERPRALNRDGRFDRRTQAVVLLDALDRVTGA